MALENIWSALQGPGSWHLSDNDKRRAVSGIITMIYKRWEYDVEEYLNSDKVGHIYQVTVVRDQIAHNMLTTDVGVYGRSA